VRRSIDDAVEHLPQQSADRGGAEGDGGELEAGAHERLAGQGALEHADAEQDGDGRDSAGGECETQRQEQEGEQGNDGPDRE